MGLWDISLSDQYIGGHYEGKHLAERGITSIHKIIHRESGGNTDQTVVTQTIKNIGRCDPSPLADSGLCDTVQRESHVYGDQIQVNYLLQWK